jgi:methionine sulfoxide reductase heme-binding subunit
VSGRIGVISLVATPSPLWFATRGTAAVTLLLLTGSIVLGIGTSARWQTGFWPRYFNPELHRNVSLMAVCFLAVHVATAILDPFARLSLTDAVLPFTSAYRPIWLGLGVIAAELTVLLVVTSALQPLLGYTAWRRIHWLAYLAWPVAVLHGLGTGSDNRMAWLLWLNVACVGAVWVTLVSWRLLVPGKSGRPLRLAVAILASAAVVVLAIWTLNGPMQPGWARVAGTPPSLLKPGQP